MEREIDFGNIVLGIIEKGKIPAPVFNPIAIKIQQLVATGPEIGEIVEMVSLDSKLSASVLQTVNSPFYGLITKKKTVADAITHLGVKESGNVVTSATLSKNFTSNDKQMQPFMLQLWRHNLGCAIGTQWLCNIVHEELSAQAFLAGLLHDFGKLILLSAIEKAKKDRTLGLPPLTNQLIYETLSKFHADQGFNLLEEMKLPQEYCSVARDHHLTYKNIDKKNVLLNLVQIANMVCKEVGIGMSIDDLETDLLETNEAKLLGLRKETSEKLKEYMKMKMRIT
jgi:HD-like signal output (HDOD) protein